MTDRRDQTPPVAYRAWGDHTPPTGLRFPSADELPLEVALIKYTLTQLVEERREARKQLRAVWITLLTLVASIAVTGGSALVQMGAYRERVDVLVDTVERLESRLGTRWERSQ